jgi:hypothetical protein
MEALVLIVVVVACGVLAWLPFELWLRSQPPYDDNPDYDPDRWSRRDD